MTCGRGIHNSITHRKAETKSSIKAEWMAPSDFDGDVIFRYTFLKEYNTFWVGAETDRVRVSRSPAAPQDDQDDQETIITEPAELEPSPKSDEAIIVVDNAVSQEAEEEEDEDIPQPAQSADIARPNSATEEKVLILFLSLHLYLSLSLSQYPCIFILVVLPAR